MVSYAILIDGGFVKRKLGTRPQPMTAEKLQRFIQRLCELPDLCDIRLHRIYYYDAHPLTQSVDKPLRGGALNFANQPIVNRNRQLLNDLSRQRFIALRMGELAFRGWTLASNLLSQDSETVSVRHGDLRPDIVQKGVDMRIGLDIASLTLKRQVQVIVLVTGDSDFIPAMKFARREGAQLYLVPMGHAIKEPMREHADLVLDVPD